MSGDGTTGVPGAQAAPVAQAVPEAAVAPGATAVPGAAVAPEAQDHDVRAVLAIRPFRALWLCLGLSSLGDWLGLLATTAMAATLGARSSDPYAAAGLAVSGVLVLRLAPAVLLGPVAGAVADRWDRRWTMVVGDLLRAGLFASIPLVGTLWWLLAATLLIEVVGLFWTPAKDASVPNLVPRHRLEAANQLSLVVTYGTAPVAALLFSALALLSGVLPGAGDPLGGRVALALYADALTYLVAAAVVSRLALPRGGPGPAGQPVPGLVRSIADGWRFVATTPLVRGLVTGMLGAFAAGGFVIGVAPLFVADLGAGEPGYGVLFGCVFTGLAVGMWTGPRVLAALARWRLFAVSLVVAGLLLFPLALIPNIVVVAGLSVAVGACGGIAWVTGYTLLGLEVADELRGRTFAFVQSAARIVLIAVLAVAPLLAGQIGRHRLTVTAHAGVDYNGSAMTLLVAAVLATTIGVLAHRQLDDGSAGPLRADLVRAWRLRHTASPELPPERTGGFFLAVEGGDGAGKSTQVEALRAWLAEMGHEVLVTREPGATALGRSLRELVLHGDDVAPRAEALLYAADRAQHVAEVVRPALQRGVLVVTDRYTDSSVAYQGAGRGLDGDEVAGLSRWATQGLVPSLTVLLDLSPEAARARLGASLDRLEREPEEFHAAVRARFLELARRAPRRYVVVDADGTPAEVAERVRVHLRPLLPPSPRQLAEAAAVRAEEERVRADAERARAAEEAARREAEAERRRAEAELKDSQRRAEAERRAAAKEQRRAEQAAERERRDAERERRDAERREADRERQAARLAAEVAARTAAAEQESARAAQERAAREEAAQERAAQERARAAREAAREAEVSRTRRMPPVRPPAGVDRDAETAPLQVDPGDGAPSTGGHRALDEELFSLGAPREDRAGRHPAGGDRASGAHPAGSWDEDETW